MDEKKSFQYKQWIILGTIIVLISYFVFTGGINTIGNAISPLLIALIIAYILNPLVNLFQRKTKLKRTGSAVMAFLVFILFFIVIVLITIPAIADTIEALKVSLTTSNENVKNTLVKIPYLNKVIDFTTLQGFIDSLQKLIINNWEKISSNLFKVLGSLTSVFTSLIIGFLGVIISFYALRDLDHSRSKIYKLIDSVFPQKLSGRIIRVIKLSDNCMKKYLVGRLYTALVLGMLTALGCVLVNLFTSITIPYIPLLALLLGIGNLVPYVGAILATVPAVLIASLGGLWSVVGLVAVIIVMQVLDNFLITPKIVGESVGLEGFWVIISITIGGNLFGLPGIVFAVPVVAVAITLIKEYRDRNDVQIIEEIKKEITKIGKKRSNKNNEYEE